MKNRTKKILNEVSSMIKTTYPFLNESDQLEMLENFVCRCLEAGLVNEVPGHEIPTPQQDTMPNDYENLWAAQILSRSKDPTNSTEDLLNDNGSLNTNAITPEMKRILSRQGLGKSIYGARRILQQATPRLSTSFADYRKGVNSGKIGKAERLKRVLIKQP